MKHASFLGFNGLEILYSGIFEVTNPSSEFRNSKWRIKYGARKCKKLLDWDDIWYSEVFGITDYEFELRIQNSESRIKYGRLKAKITWLGWYLILEGFWSRWLRIRAQNLKIRNGGFHMADKNAKSYLIGMIFGTLEFSGQSLQLELKIEKFKLADTNWRIQPRCHGAVLWRLCQAASKKKCLNHYRSFSVYFCTKILFTNRLFVIEVYAIFRCTLTLCINMLRTKYVCYLLVYIILVCTIMLCTVPINALYKF